MKEDGLRRLVSCAGALGGKDYKVLNLYIFFSSLVAVFSVLHRISRTCYERLSRA